MIARASSASCALAGLLLILSLSSCDRSPARAPTTTIATEPSFEVELKPLTPLLPNRTTHPAVDSLGNIYWVQEADRRDDVLFVIGEGEVPRVTQLSARRFPRAVMGSSGRQGHIQDVAAGPDGEIYFYFYGELGPKSLAAFGRYVPRTSKIQILADTSILADASGMGLSLPLAHGRIVFDGRSIWLWLRRTDAWAMFRIDPTKLPASGTTTLAKAYTATALDGRPLDLTRNEYDISAAGDDKLFLIDPVEGRLMTLSSGGVAKVVQSLLGFPSTTISTPTLDAKGQILVFAANADPIKPAKVEDIDNPTPPNIAYPAMLVFGDHHLLAISQTSSHTRLPSVWHPT